MKSIATLSIILAVAIPCLALAQTDAMKGMDMSKCTSMKGMDMAGMDAQKCSDIMSGSDAKTMTTYKAMAVVKKVDAANGKVILAHDAVKGLNWPAMTMGFAVKDKALMSKLAVGKQVNVEFKKDGADYVVISVK